MDTLRAISIILAVAGLVVYGVLAWRYPRARLYLIAPVSWLVFVLVFVAASYGNSRGVWTVEPQTLNIWSTAVRLYSLLLVVGIGLVWMVTGDIPGDIPNEPK